MEKNCNIQKFDHLKYLTGENPKNIRRIIFHGWRMTTGTIKEDFANFNNTIHICARRSDSLFPLNHEKQDAFKKDSEELFDTFNSKLSDQINIEGTSMGGMLAMLGSSVMNDDDFKKIQTIELFMPYFSHTMFDSAEKAIKNFAKKCNNCNYHPPMIIEVGYNDSMTGEKDGINYVKTLLMNGYRGSIIFKVTNGTHKHDNFSKKKCIEIAYDNHSKKYKLYNEKKLRDEFPYQQNENIKLYDMLSTIKCQWYNIKEEIEDDSIELNKKEELEKEKAEIMEAKAKISSSLKNVSARLLILRYAECNKKYDEESLMADRSVHFNNKFNEITNELQKIVNTTNEDEVINSTNKQEKSQDIEKKLQDIENTTNEEEISGDCNECEKFVTKKYIPKKYILEEDIPEKYRSNIINMSNMKDEDKDEDKKESVTSNEEKKQPTHQISKMNMTQVMKEKNEEKKTTNTSNMEDEHKKESATSNQRKNQCSAKTMLMNMKLSCSNNGNLKTPLKIPTMLQGMFDDGAENKVDTKNGISYEKEAPNTGYCCF